VSQRQIATTDRANMFRADRVFPVAQRNRHAFTRYPAPLHAAGARIFFLIDAATLVGKR